MSQRNSLLSPRGISPGVVIIFIVALLVVFRFATPNLFLKSFAPVLAEGSRLTSGVRSFTGGFENAAALSRERDQLVEQNAALTVQNRALSEQIADITKTLLTAPNSSGVLAGVVGRPPVAPYDTLVVEAGSDTGVVSGMEAFGPSGTPLGLVTNVTPSFTRVTLFSASGQTTSAWVGTGRLPITLLGEGGGAFSAKVPREAKVNEGDVVFVPGPGALPIGVISKVDIASSSPSAALYIRPVVNPFSVTWIVLKDTGVRTFTATSTKP